MSSTAKAASPIMAEMQKLSVQAPKMAMAASGQPQTGGGAPTSHQTSARSPKQGIQHAAEIVSPMEVLKW